MGHEFFKALRDPQAHYERVQAEAKANLDHRLKVSQVLGISPKPKEETRHFQTLAEALDSVATGLETDAVADLVEEMEALEDLLEIGPGWPCTFQQYLHAFREIHLRQDLRRLYVDREFPENVE